MAGRSGGAVITGGRGGGFGGFFGDNRHKYNLTLSINALNVLNHTNVAGYNGVLTSSFFGIGNRSAGQARRIEAALRFNF
jgi:hypothetical protein